MRRRERWCYSGGVIVQADGRQKEQGYKQRQSRVKSGEVAVQYSCGKAEHRQDDEKEDNKIAGVFPKEGKTVKGGSADGQIREHLFACGEERHGNQVLVTTIPVLSTFVSTAISRPSGARIGCTSADDFSVTMQMEGPTELIATNSRPACRRAFMWL